MHLGQSRLDDNLVPADERVSYAGIRLIYFLHHTVGTDSSNRKRDVLGLMSAPEAMPSRPADGPEPAAAEDGGGGVKGGLKPMEGEPGHARCVPYVH